MDERERGGGKREMLKEWSKEEREGDTGEN